MAAGATYEPISTTTLGSAQTSVTFSSISGSYTDLVLIANAKANTGGVIGFLYEYNNDTANNYSFTYLNGNGSSASSGRVTSGIPALGDLAGSSSSPGAYIVHINNYSNSTTYKTTLSRGNDAAAVTQALVGLWRSTSAITQIKLYPNSGIQFASGSTFTLYGITAA
jgi:hypothetical protein